MLWPLSIHARNFFLFSCSQMKRGKTCPRRPIVVGRYIFGAIIRKKTNHYGCLFHDLLAFQLADRHSPAETLVNCGWEVLEPLLLVFPWWRSPLPILARTLSLN